MKWLRNENGTDEIQPVDKIMIYKVEDDARDNSKNPYELWHEASSLANKGKGEKNGQGIIRRPL